MLSTGRPPGRRLEKGSLVIVYEARSVMKAVVVSATGHYGSRYGNFSTGDWVGLPYGAKAYGAIFNIF